MASGIKRIPGAPLSKRQTSYYNNHFNRSYMIDDRKIATAQAYVAARNDLQTAIAQYGSPSNEALAAEKILRKARTAYLKESKRG